MLARRVLYTYPGDELTQRIHLVLVSTEMFSCFISSGDSTCLHRFDITNTRLMLMTCVQQPATPAAPRQQYSTSTMLSYCEPTVTSSLVFWLSPIHMIRDVHENRIKFVHGGYELKLFKSIRA